MNFWPYKIFVIFYIMWERSANIGKNTSAGFIGIYCSTGESKQKKHLMTIICESFLLHLYTLAKQIKGTLDHHGITQSGTHHWYRCWPQNWYYRLCMRRNRKSYIITLSRVLAHVSDYTVKNRLHQSGMRSSYTLVGLLLASQHSPLSTITD